MELLTQQLLTNMKSPNLVKRYLLRPDQIKAIILKAKELSKLENTNISESEVVRRILDDSLILKAN